VFQSRAGLVARINVTAIQPNTPAQFLIRASLASISETWRSAAMNAYRAAWITLAIANPYLDIFGVQRRLTGGAFFAKLNRNLATLGLPVILTAPTTLSTGAPGLLSLSHTVGPPEQFLVTPTVQPAGTEAVVIRATKPLSPAMQTLHNTQAVIQTFSAGTNGPWDIFTAYKAKNKNVASGQQVFVLVNYVNATTGFAGQQSIDAVLW